MNEHTDTSLTDYALGELSDAERLQFELRLKTDSAARDEVDETVRISGMLRCALSRTAASATVDAINVDAASPSLRELVRNRIGAAAQKSPATLGEKMRAVAAVGIGAVLAASLALVVGGREASRPDASTEVARAGGVVDADEDYAAANHQLDAKHVPSEQAQWFFKTNDHLTMSVPPARGDDARPVKVFTQQGSTFAASVPETPHGPIIHSPTPMALGDKLVTSNSTATSTLTPRILVTGASPEPQTRRFMLGVGVNSNAGVVGDVSGNSASPTGGETAKPATPSVVQAEMFPLLLAHQEASTKYGPNHPKVLEIELKLKAISSLTEELSANSVEASQKSAPPHDYAEAKLGRLLVRNRADAPNVEFKVDVDADGIADTRWIDLGRPSKPGEIPDFQMLTDLMTSTIQPETWREVRTEEELEQHLARHSAYVDFQARLDSVRRAEQKSNPEQYQSEPENPFVRATDEPLSTFSIDVDTASYSNVRRILNTNQIPTPDTIRLEEFLNYFTYDYPTPTGDAPFSVTTEAARCPWNADHTLVRIGLKGREVHRKERPASNLVFLVDVSGSMQDQNKLPLVRESLKMMVNELGDSDRVAIVVYAGSEGLALPPTGGDRKRTILETLDRLESGGSTNGAAGIQLAYQIAAENFIPKGINRVILATDGDFNVGVTSQGELVRLIEEKAKTGVFFSALGYGMGNLKDSTLEQLADKGNGNYAYIDTISEARKVLVEQMSGTLMTIAKDVKIQIEFNPTTVAGYRLLGYENRMLAAQDFNDDKKDAGEIGAGHTVTALYELIPVSKAAMKEVKKLPEVDPLKYQAAPVVPPQSAELAQELLTLKLRYKEPDGERSKLIETPVKNDVVDYGKASNDFKFASAVAGFGMLLRHSKYHGSATFDGMIELAESSLGRDVGGYRKEFVELVRKARDLRKR